MKALDLFCGLGGWSDGLIKAGFEVVGVELRNDLAKLYKHPVIITDVCSLDPKQFRYYDLIVGSPPCRDFSVQTFCANRKGNPWKIAPDPEGRGMKLVNAFIDFVKIAKPRYWLMENVIRLEKYFNMPPKMKVKIAGNKWRYFWGHFPEFKVPYYRGKSMRYTGKWRSPLNAYIPMGIGKALGKAIKRRGRNEQAYNRLLAL